MVRAVLVALALAAASIRPYAHHAFDSEFDRKKRLTLQGVVTRVEWTNPHGVLHVDVKDATGRVAAWRVQTAPPGVLGTLGWRKGAVAPGAFVIVEGFQARSGERLLHGHDVSLADGTRLCANIPCRCCPAPGTSGSNRSGG